jgi:hypothetical protein
VVAAFPFQETNMSRTEIQNLKVALSMPSVAGRLSRLRLLLSAIEKDEHSRSKRVCDGLRKAFHRILKTENLDNEVLATASRLLIRLDRIDPWKQRTRSEKQKALERAESAAAAPDNPQPDNPQPETSPVNDELERRNRMIEEGL